MTNSIYRAFPAEPGQIELLEKEQTELLEKQESFRKAAARLLWAGLIALFCGVALYSFLPNCGVLLTLLAVAAWMSSAAFEAARKGQSAYWGLIPCAFYLLPDLHALRLDELELALTGQRGSRASEDRQRVIQYLLIGVAFIALQMFKQSKTKPPPIVPAVEQTPNGGMTVPASSVDVEGSHCRIRISAGWTECPRSETKTSDDLDLCFRLKTLGAQLIIRNPQSKNRLQGATLLDFAKIHESLTRERLKDVVLSSGLIADALRGKPAYRFDLQCRTKEGIPHTNTFYLWETTDHFWVAESILIFDGVGRNRELVRSAVESIETKHE